MVGVILAVQDDPAAAARLLHAAQRLAELSGSGRVIALLVRTPPDALMTAEEVLTAHREAELREVEAERATAVRAVFDAWAATLPDAIEPRWIDTDGIPELVVEEHGQRADYLVVKQPSRHDYGASWQILRAAIFTTDRPVLVVPPASGATIGRRVAIAWRDDPRATKAVLAALRCLQHAERVLVLAGTRGAPVALPPILAEHGVAAELHRLTIGGTFGAVLLDRAHALGADMLVMGAYQHSPLRELLLGGVTRHVLNHSDLPVLLRH